MDANKRYVFDGGLNVHEENNFKLLWTNENPGEPYEGGTTITFPYRGDDKYTLFVMLFNLNKDVQNYKTVMAYANGAGTLVDYTTIDHRNDKVTSNQRYITVTANDSSVSIAVQSGLHFEFSASGSSYATNNDILIPYQIFGIVV